MKDKLTRRKFVQSSALGVSAMAMGTKAVHGAAVNEKVRLGWIGMGGRGIELLNRMHLSNAKNIRTVAVCDLKQERIDLAKKVAKGDNPTGYKDFRKMLDKEKLDGVLIATWPNTHAEISIPVLQAGIHCFCEKPLDIDVESVDAVTKVARKADCIYQLGTQRRYNPGFVSGMPMITGGKFGKVAFMQGHWHWHWWWTNYPLELRGGMFLDQACHHMDVMNWAMGNQHPATACAMGYNMVQPPEEGELHSPTHISATFKYPTGQVFSYTHLFCLPKQFTDEKLWVFCEKGCADVGHGLFYPSDKPGGDKEIEPKRIGEDSENDWNKGIVEELKDFVDNIKTGGKRTPKANIETARIATLTGIMGRESLINREKHSYDPRLVQWKDLGTTTDPA